MMKKLITVIQLTLCSFAMQAQDTSGIQFAKNLTWTQILTKAKTEHKYVFVDCYATWCAPCREMDEKIYPVKQIGDVYNKNFVSVKIQMDRTKNDNDIIKSWYG